MIGEDFHFFHILLLGACKSFDPILNYVESFIPISGLRRFLCRVVGPIDTSLHPYIDWMPRAMTTVYSTAIWRHNSVWMAI